jgi:hypothetical protein
MLFLLLLYAALAACVAMMAMIRGRPGWAWFLRALFFTPFVCGPLVVALPREGGAFLASDEVEREWERLETAPADSTIRIVRHDAFADRNKPYGIFINGAQVGTVGPDGVADFRVPHGAVLIEARNDWGASRPLKVDTARNHRVDIEVSNRFRRGWRGFGARLFGSDNPLSLRQLPAIDRPSGPAYT